MVRIPVTPGCLLSIKYWYVSKRNKVPFCPQARDWNMLWKEYPIALRSPNALRNMGSNSVYRQRLFAVTHQRAAITKANSLCLLLGFEMQKLHALLIAGVVVLHNKSLCLLPYSRQSYKGQRLIPSYIRSDLICILRVLLAPTWNNFRYEHSLVQYSWYIPTHWNLWPRSGLPALCFLLHPANWRVWLIMKMRC